MSERPPHTESELIEQLHAIDVRAPEALHARIGELVAAAPGARAGGGVPGRSAPRWHTPARRLAGAVAFAALAVVLLVAFLGGIGGGSSEPVLRADVALTLAPATAGAPSERPGGGALTASVDGLSFPYWEASFGWRSTGARVDRLNGYPVTTVFYADGSGRRIGYAILGGPPPGLSGGSVSWRNGTAYRLLTLQGARVVAWLRDGRLCVIAGRNVGYATLLRLAGWSAAGRAAA